MKYHDVTVHQQLKNFSCPRCDFRASSDYKIKTHVKVVHEKIRDFVCDQVGCGYASGAAKELRIHKWKKHGISD